MRQFENKAMRQLGLREKIFKFYLFDKQVLVRSNLLIF